MLGLAVVQLIFLRLVAFRKRMNEALETSILRYLPGEYWYTSNSSSEINCNTVLRSRPILRRNVLIGRNSFWPNTRAAVSRIKAGVALLTWLTGVAGSIISHEANSDVPKCSPPTWPCSVPICSEGGHCGPPSNHFFKTIPTPTVHIGTLNQAPDRRSRPGISRPQ